MELTIMRKSARGVSGARFADGGRKLVLVDAGGTADLWDIEGQKVNRRLRSEVDILRYRYMTAFSPDTSRYITSTQRTAVQHFDPKVYLWDTDSGELLGRLEGHTSYIINAAYSPDGTLIATVGDDGTVRVWNGVDGKEIGILPGETNNVVSVAFSHDSKLLATASDDGTARVWQASNLNVQVTLKRQTGDFTSVAISPDNRRAATASASGIVVVWDIREGENLSLHTTAPGDSYERIELNADWLRMGTTQDTWAHPVWDKGRCGSITIISEAEYAAREVRLLAGGTRVITIGEETLPRIWNADTGEPIGTLEGLLGVINPGNINSRLRLLVDRTRILTRSPEGFKLWDAATAMPVANLGQHSDAAKWQTSDLHILIMPANAPAQLFDATTGARVEALDATGTIAVGGWFSRNSQLLAIHSASNEVQIFRTGSGEHVHTLKGHERQILEVRFSPADDTILTQTSEGKIRLWDAASGTVLHTFDADGRNSVVAFSPSGSLILTGGDRDSVDVWSVETGKRLYQVSTPTGSLDTVQVSPDDRMLLVLPTEDSNELRIVNAKTGALLKRTEANQASFAPQGTGLFVHNEHIEVWDSINLEIVNSHEMRPWEQAGPTFFTSDGGRLVVNGDWAIAKLREPKDGKIVAALPGLYVIRRSSLAPGVNRVITTNGTTAFVWHLFLSTQALTDYVKREAPRCLTADQRADFHLDPDIPDWCTKRQKWPFSLWGQLAIADALRENNAYTDAIERLTDALALAPDHRGLILELSHTYLLKAEAAFGDSNSENAAIEGARQDVTRSLELNPRNGDALTLRGLILVQLGEWATAIDDLTAGMIIVGERTEALEARAIAYQMTGRTELANADLSRKWELEGDAQMPLVTWGRDPSEHYAKALELGSQSNHELAQKLALAKRYERAHEATYRAEQFHNKGDYNSALASYGEAIDARPELASGYVSRGWVFVDAQRFSEALRDANQALEKSSNDVDALELRGYVYSETERLDEALEDWSRVIQTGARRSWALRQRSTLHRNAGRLDSALADANFAVNVDELGNENYANRARIFGALKRYDDAIQDYTIALQYSSSASYFNGRAWWRYKKGDLALALDDANSAIERAPDASSYFDTRGQIYLALGRHEEALMDLTDAIRYGGDWLGTYYARGRAHEYLGHVDEAISDYAETLKRDAANDEGERIKEDARRRLNALLEAQSAGNEEVE
jgi:WD40 repeat protein/tetratricopeptide (TPR) repeat protein